MIIPDIIVFALFASMALIALYNLARAVYVLYYVSDAEGRRLLRAKIVFCLAFGVERIMLLAISGAYTASPIPQLRTLILDYSLWFVVELALLLALVFWVRSFWKSISPYDDEVASG